MQKVYTKIESIVGNVVTVKAEGVRLGDLALVGDSYATVIKLDRDIVSLQVFAGAQGVGWGSGVWGLLAFSMQMALVLVLGSALANAPAIKRIIVKLAGVPKKPAGAVAFVTIISAICCFINWGFGLIIGALLAKEVAKKIKGLDYRLIIAAAYSGFVIWHSGISGSIPLGMTALDVDGTVANTGGAVTEVVPTSQTIFSAWNLIMITNSMNRL